MDLEPRTLETVGSRCEECGATLTEAEIAAALDSDGRFLCSVHAVEAVPIAEEDEPL